MLPDQAGHGRTTYRAIARTETMAESIPSSGATVPVSPSEQVLAQLGRQKWAVDTRDADALTALYTADSAQVVYQGGPDGRKELTRLRGRDEIMRAITAGWERTAATWYPGALIHQIGSVVTERPATAGSAAGPTLRSWRWTRPAHRS